MCGIFGLINKDQAIFDKGIFNILGIANDVRGGDSCGIFIDGKTEYGVDKKKLYQDFFLDSKLIKSTSECKVAFGHCRKTSVGKTSLETAQPVVIKEGDEIKYVLLHNGTIYNYEELAKKYIPDIDIKGMSDSQVMARIFYYKGYDALSEYNGGAVFVIADYRDNPKPRIFFWKGESKKTAYAKVSFEERPFYYVNKDGKFIFSSIPYFLEGYVNDECWTIHSNTLVEYINGNIYINKKFNRNNCQQDKEYKSINSSTAYNSNSNNSNYSGGWGSSNYVYLNDLGEYMLKQKKLHGKVFCSAYGIAFDNSFQSPNSQYFYFYNGVLLYNEEAFNFIEMVREHFSIDIPEYTSYEVFCRDYPEIVAYFSYSPIMMCNDKVYLTVTENLMWEKFDGEFRSVLTTAGIHNCKNGKIISTTYSNSISSFEAFKAASKAFYFDKESLVNLINTTYGVSIRL